MDAILRRVQEKIQRSLRGGGAAGSKYFSVMRRGEDAELQADLNSTDIPRQKKAVKRIIANMTMGRDVSALFVHVVKLGQTTNFELKKLVYLYVLNTAKLQPDKAILAVNTFLQDATNPSPIVRALAVRTMLGIRVSSVLDYTMEPLRRAATDPDPYVRKTAVIGLGKLFHNNMNAFYEHGYATELVRLLMDTNSVVCSNAAAILQEVNDYGSQRIESCAEWIPRLLMHIPETTPWGQVYLLHLLSSIVMRDTDASENIVTRVLPRLNHGNPAVVMASIRVIAAMASKCTPETIERCTARINAALLTLACEMPEMQYIVCKNIHALLVIFPNLLGKNLDAFYVRFNDPPYVKLAKLHLLLKLVTPSTGAGVVEELNEYSREVDSLFVEEVIAAIASLAIKVDSVSVPCSELLMQVVSRRPELLPQVVTAAKNIMRKYPDILLLEPLITQYGVDAVVEEEAKVSFIWMLGEYCDFVEGGPEMLQQYISTFMSHEYAAQLAILNAVVKAFLRAPTEMEATLIGVLETINAKSVDPDVRDRAFAYWRLLSQGVSVDKMKSIVHDHIPPLNVDRTFSDVMTMGDLKRSINTSAALYGKPFQHFLRPYGLMEAAQQDDEEEDEIEETVDGAGPSDDANVDMPSSSPIDAFDDLFGAVEPHPQQGATQQQHPMGGQPTAYGQPPGVGKLTTSLDDLFA